MANDNNDNQPSNGFVVLRNEGAGRCLGVSTGGAFKGLMGGPTLVDCPADAAALADLSPSGTEDAAGHLLWQTDKLWGTNGAGVGSSALAPRVPQLPATLRQHPFPETRQ